ncbi:hypothetical protein CC_2034 [Caulobacter vibrioides CB15]|uniref:Uncharacterized protein n=2 Tax=Caulobacter vibrioides TaxID=155892 RepID=Q9A6Q0_CAUVC|nr:hypothetical protein CC_2034 [Caulobacter vibrioides CB15]
MRRRRARSSLADAVLLGNRTTPLDRKGPGAFSRDCDRVIAVALRNDDHSASSGRMAAWCSYLVNLWPMGTRNEHLGEAERLERQAEIADNAHARAALLRMAQASRGAAALLGLFEAGNDEAPPVVRG